MVSDSTPAAQLNSTAERVYYWSWEFASGGLLDAEFKLQFHTAYRQGAFVAWRLS